MNNIKGCVRKVWGECKKVKPQSPPKRLLSRDSGPSSIQAPSFYGNLPPNSACVPKCEYNDTESKKKKKVRLIFRVSLDWIC